MLYLLLDAGADTYAIESSYVELVVPFAELKQAPGAPPTIAGILNYHGRPLAVVDCGEMLAGRPCAPQAGTRIVICRIKLNGTERLIGLLGENINRTHSFEDADFQPPSVRANQPKCAGPVAAWNGRLVQRIVPGKIIRADVVDTLLAGAKNDR